MLPSIKNGDIVNIYPKNRKKLKLGDVVCYDNGNYFVVHRIVDVDINGENTKYIMKGDNMPREDMYSISEEQIVGIYKEDSSPLMYYMFSFNKAACIITSLDEIRKFIISICPTGTICLYNKFGQSNVKINLMIYKENECYFIDVFYNDFRKKYMHKSIDEAKGNIYAILFRSDYLKREFKKCISIHAGSVMIKEQLVLVLGESGKGKSSLTYYLTKRGFKYFSDETVYMQKEGKFLKTIPFYTPLMLRKDIAIANNILEKIYVNKESYLEEKFIIGVNNIVKEPQDATGIIIIPDWNPKNTFYVKKISSTDAFSSIVKNLSSSEYIDKVNIILYILKNFDVYYLRYSNTEQCINKIEKLINERKPKSEEQ